LGATVSSGPERGRSRLVGPSGIGLKATSEHDALNDAIGNCAKRDTDRYVALGPLAVGRKRSAN